MITTVSEVFSCRQYSDGTLKRLHADLLANPSSAKRGTWEADRLNVARKEMERRGIRVGRAAK